MGAMTNETIAQYKDVFVFAQQVDNELSGIAFELLGKAKDLAADLDAKVAAVLIGSDVKGLVDQLAGYGACLLYTSLRRGIILLEKIYNSQTCKKCGSHFVKI